jgi:uncharacterized protein (TIRG00374 family)
MNKKKIFQILVLIVLITWFGIYFYQHFDEFRDLKIVNSILLIPISLLAVIFLINNGLVLKYFLKPFNIKLKFKEWFGLSVITTMGNYLTPFRGGAVARAVYLKRIHQFPHAYFLSTLAGIYIVVFLVNSFVGVLTMIFLYHFLGVFNILIFTIFLAIFLTLLAIIIFSPRFKETKYPFFNKFINVLNGWHLIKSNKKMIAVIGLISVINVGIIVLMMFLEFRVFGLEIPLLSALFLSIVSTLGLFISITPGALGIKEAIIVFTATVINIPVSQALTVSILDRVVGLVIIAILGPIFLVFWRRREEKRIQIESLVDNYSFGYYFNYSNCSFFFF